MSDFRIEKIEEVGKGKIYHLMVGDRGVRILITKHAEERMARWGLSIGMVLETLLYPEEVLVGHHGRYIAHRRYGMHLVRAVYEYEGELPVLVTVYFPSVKRYFRGGGVYEDKILP